MTARWRCLFWVQSLLGSGHLRRALLVAEAIAARGAEVTLANGGLPGPWPAAPGVEMVQLAPLVANGADFAALVDPAGVPATPELLAARGRRLLTLLDALAPDAVVTEMFPFGRRAFRDELLPLLDAARARRAPRPVIAASLRDVLVSKPDPARRAWMVETCRAFYDRVLVHGDERLLPLAASFPPAASLGDRVVHTGFVRPPPAAAGPPADAPAVLVSAGGGAVGDRLLPAALAARSLSRLARAPWLLVGGSNLPRVAFAGLATAAPPGVTVARHRADLPALMAAAAVSVSQAGYNTVVEGLSVGARMVLVPFAAGGEDEQTRRAARLAELGLAELVPEAELTPGRLAAAIDRAASRPRPSAATWSFDGAARGAAILAEAVEARRRGG